MGYTFLGDLMESVFAMRAFTQINGALNPAQLVEFCNMHDAGAWSQHNATTHLAVQRHAMMHRDNTNAMCNRGTPNRYLARTTSWNACKLTTTVVIMCNRLLPASMATDCFKSVNFNNVCVSR